MTGWPNSTSIILLLVSAAAIGGALGHFSDPSDLADAAKRATTNASPKCRIKGNISIDKGERIFHVPGQRYYEATKIDMRYGERWFCSEAEARSAGWRKAKQ